MPGSVLDVLDNTNYVRQYMMDRNKIYNIYWKYYLGVQYDDTWLKAYFKLYTAVREFYNLVSRAVDIDVQLVPGGWLVADPTQQPKVDAVLSDSNWRKNGGLMVHNGAICGDFYVKCVEREDGTKYVQPLDTRGCWLDADRAIFIRDKVNVETGVAYEYGELLTATEMITYIDGEEQETYTHSFGQVPVFYGQNKDVGLDNGLNAFYNVIDELNAVNEMATLMQESGLRALYAQKVITGASSKEIEINPDKTMFLPDGTKFETVDMNMKVAEMLTFLQDVYDKTRSNLPEMIFDALGSASNTRSLFSPGRDSLEFVAQELIIKIQRMRLGYDEVLSKAVQLCDPSIGEFEFDPNRSVLGIDVGAVPSPELTVTTPTAAGTQETQNG